MKVFSRILRTIALVAILVSALLVFPHRIPEFAGLGLVWCTIRTIQREKFAADFIAIPAWLMIKWPEPTLPMFCFALSTICAAVSSRFESDRRNALLIIIWTTWGVWLWHHHAGAIGQSNSGDNRGPIVCLGDSLTDFGYPSDLALEIEQPVADFGFNGYTTVDGIKLVPEIVTLKPTTVIIELGGHDFRNRKTRIETQDNLRFLIESFQSVGSKVILVEIPRGFVNDPWFGMERELAREYDLHLIQDTMIRRLVFWSPIIPPGSFVSKELRLSEDGLHPNQRGNTMMARTIAGYIDED